MSWLELTLNEWLGAFAVVVAVAVFTVGFFVDFSDYFENVDDEL